ncbi:MAG: MraY family glycosyltransferase, partial [Limnohabitans sp.]
MISLPPFVQALATTALLVSVVVGVLLVVTGRFHNRYSADPFEGAQKLHSEVTPRVGGLAVYLGVLAAYGVASALNLRVTQHLAVLLLAGLPAWLLGMLEDLTKHVRPRWRMLATMTSGVIASLLSGVSITHLGVSGLDVLLQVAPISILFTAFAVAGVTNAVNLIDGMNGLASGFACVAFGALGFIALSEGDYPMVRYCVVLGASSL